MKGLEPANLPQILDRFKTFMPTVVGDGEGIERIAYELCQFQAENKVVYFETRYSPQLLANCNVALEWGQKPGNLTPHDVVLSVNEGLRKGCEDFGVKANSILCCFQHRPEWSAEVLSLCREFQDRGVVGMDIAGYETVPFDPLHIQAFQEAARCGIHRTAHAGESSSAEAVREAVDKMNVERLGHGYLVLQDEELYQRVKKMNIHFEASLISSYYTGVCKLENFDNHPVKRFAEDDVNFSLSTDDPGVFLCTFDDEFDLAFDKVGLNEAQITKSIFNAARSAFLPEAEKRDLIEQLMKEYNAS
ncbi:adenosine deaminase-like [Ptychodera flava]|uniref:adenosine deaminase-like n=1 Tax=Ptychodera flava TaxID=63121 RepID=UPI00396A55AD